MPDESIDVPHDQHVRISAPSLIVFHGPGLERPVLLKDWRENYFFVRSLDAPDPAAEDAVPSNASVPVLTGRPSVEVALFWGPSTARFKRSGLLMERWPVAEAEQHARFHPAAGREAAIWMFVDPASGTASRVQRLSDAALAALQRYGVPITIP